MLGIGDDPIPPPGPEARTGRASNEDKAIAVAAPFMDFLLCRRIMNPDCATATLAQSGICEEPELDEERGEDRAATFLEIRRRRFGRVVEPVGQLQVEP